jgi:amino acid transporter
MSAQSGGLRRELGMRDQVMLALASVSPAYSIALSFAAMIAIAGFVSPAIVVVGFLPNMGLAVAFYYLNRHEPDCGTTYKWVATSLHPSLGTVMGSILNIQAVLALAFAVPFLGQVTIDLLRRISSSVSLSTTSLTASTVIGVAFFAALAAVAVIGIRETKRLQWILFVIEISVVVVLSVVGIIRGEGSGFHGWWLNPFHVHGANQFATAIVVSIFLYAGWNTGVSLNEESHDPTGAPGKAPLFGLWALLLTFLIANISVQMTLSPTAISNAGSESLAAWADKVFGHTAATIAVFALFTSTLAVLQTTFIVLVRTVFSMSRAGALGPMWQELSPRTHTPAKATIILAAAVGSLVIAYQELHTLNAIIIAGITASGILIGLTYALTAIACVVRFRARALSSARDFLLVALIPSLSAASLLAVSVYVLEQEWTSTNSYSFSGGNGRFQASISFAAIALAVLIAVAEAFRRQRAVMSAPDSAPDPVD